MRGARWVWGTVPAGCLAGALIAGQVGHGVPSRQVASRGDVGARTGPARVFGLALPGEGGRILFARARRSQPGGPETVRAVRTGRYEPLTLAPDAEVWVTAPLAAGEQADYVQGSRVAPGGLAALFAAARRQLGGLPERARMFELWLDDRGRVLRMRHYFSP